MGEALKRPLAVDLCCGRGGWTRGLMAAGWDVIGFDIERSDYPAQLVLQDVRTMAGAPLRLAGVSLIVASPPCEQFSYIDLPWGRKDFRLGKVAAPDLSIVAACWRIASESGVPIVLENVRGAMKWIGPAMQHYGPYYLWGDVPLLMPWGKPEKGLSLKRVRGRRLLVGPRGLSSSSPRRKAWSKTAAMVPFELAYWVGECFAPAGTDLVRPEKQNGRAG